MYKDMFCREQINAIELEEARKLASVLWNVKSYPEDKIDAMIDFCKAICPSYEIKIPKLIFDRTMEIHGIADRANNIIYLKNFSFVSFLHEFRHMTQGKRLINNFITNYPATVDHTLTELQFNMEEDARGYSVSVYYILFPDKYEKAVANHTLSYI